MRQTIIINELSPMLNGKKGLKRMHWSTYKKIRDKWHVLILSKTRKRHEGRVAISFTRFSTGKPDWDNLYSGFKVIGDALQRANIIIDDSMDIVTSLDACWEIAPRLMDQHTEIRIKDVT